MASRSSGSERDRVRYLLALDAAGVMRRLAERREEMVEVFSRLRDREALITPLRSTFDTMQFSELVRLTLREQRAVHAFHEALDDLRWYLRYTVDMPGTLEQRFAHYLRELEHAHQRLTAALGKVTETEIDADFPMRAPPRRKKRARK